MSTQPRYFLATDTDDGSGSMALWRERPDDPDRPDPVLWQHNTDPGVWDAAVALLTGTPAYGPYSTPPGSDAIEKAELFKRLHERFSDEFMAGSGSAAQQSATANASALAVAALAALGWVYQDFGPAKADELSGYMQHYVDNGFESDEWFVNGADHA